MMVDKSLDSSEVITEEVLDSVKYVQLVKDELTQTQVRAGDQSAAPPPQPPHEALMTPEKIESTREIWGKEVCDIWEKWGLREKK